jgi:hypothetical protein
MEKNHSAQAGNEMAILSSAPNTPSPQYLNGRLNGSKGNLEYRSVIWTGGVIKTGVNGNHKQGSAIIPQTTTLGSTIIQTNNILPLFN